MERKDSIESTEKIVILEGSLTADEDDNAGFESVVWRKVDICVVGAVTVFYLLSWLDRTNLGNARIAGLQTDLRLTDNQYSISLTMTLIPFLCSGLPVNLLMKIVGPNILLPTLLTLWGIVTTLQGTVHTFGGLLACRFFLGFFEGGMIPAITLYMSLFYPRAKLQQRLSIVYSAASLAGAFSGLLAAAILHMDGIGGKPGWAWIFILEGLFTVFFGLLSFFVIPRSAKHCTLLNAREREYVMDRLREDGALSQHESADHFAWGEIVQALKFPHVWFILVLFFFNGILIYSLG